MFWTSIVHLQERSYAACRKYCVSCWITYILQNNTHCIQYQINIWTIICTWLPGSNKNKQHSHTYIYMSQTHSHLVFPPFVLPIFTHQDTYPFHFLPFQVSVFPMYKIYSLSHRKPSTYVLHTFIFSCPYRINLTSILELHM